jgi:hypothetical protein
MDERDMEEERNEKKGEGWGTGIEKVILFGKFWNCYFVYNQKIKYVSIFFASISKIDSYAACF